MGILNSTSLDWALKHLDNIGDNSLFPKPFEIAAIKAKWSEVKENLLSLNKYTWSSFRRLIVPKTEYFYRKATQLDPIDSLVIASFIHQFGNKIECNRIPISEQNVFSYRFEPDDAGQLYSRQVNWDKFWNHSLSNATYSKNKFVIVADISDYYNQISHHTIENELISYEIPRIVVNSIKTLLSHITQGVSRGIPVGPHSVHLLAEAAFNPIDKYLKAVGYQFTRFVDDIHIFCTSKNKAKIALLDLANVLDSTQRLTLNSSKTRILKKGEFIEYAKNKINETLPKEIERKIIKVIKKYSQGDPYAHISINRLTNTEIKLLNSKNIKEIFEYYLSCDNIDYQKIRWWLNRLSQVGIPNAILYLIKKFNEILPAIGEFCIYIASTQDTYKGNWKDLGKLLTKCINHEIVKHSEYITMILTDLFSKVIGLNQIEFLLTNFNDRSSIIKRKIIKVATKANMNYWLRNLKEQFSSVDPWQKRALLLSASTYAEDEKTHWIRRLLKDETSLLNQITAKWVMDGGTI